MTDAEWEELLLSIFGWENTEADDLYKIKETETELNGKDIQD